MQKSFTRRVLFAVVIALVITTALSIAVSAASVTYNYSEKYSSHDDVKYNPENAAAGGFEFNHGGMLFYMGNSATFQDASATEVGYVDETIRLTYHIPEAEQVNIKDYGAIRFDRRMSNGGALIKSYGASFGVTLVMDDGQTIEREYLWARIINDVDLSGDASKEYVDVDIVEEINALEGNPKLVSIVYTPYVESDYFAIPDSHLPVPDDPATEDVNEKVAGKVYYFMLKYFTLEEAAEAPANLGSVTDTWDGTTVTEHNGKITGLDAAKSYKYAPVHSYEADYVAVSGKTEITGLVGGVYEVIATEEGKVDSPKTIVVVPKTTQPAFTNLDTPNGKYSYSFTPKSGYWTSMYIKPSPASSKYVHSYFVAESYWNKTNFGHNNFMVADTAAAHEYYAHNVQAHTYTLTPEEQFSVDAKSMDFSVYIQNVGLGYPWDASTFGFTVYIYVNGETEPAASMKGLWTKSSNEMWINDINLSSEYDGYVTGIKVAFITDYPDTDGVAGQRYFMSRGMRTKDLTPNTFVPAVEKMSATSYKIGNLDVSKTYRFSTDGVKFEEIKDSTFVSFEGAKVYIQELGTGSCAASEVFEVTAANFQPDVTGVALNGNVLSGFDANTAYEYAPVNVFDKVWTDVEGTSLELTAGVWAVRVKASDTLGAGAPKYFFIKGEKSGTLTWAGGGNTSFVQGKWGEATGDGSPYFQYKEDKFLGGAFNFASNFTQEGVATTFADHPKFAWQYALTDDEVFPIKNFNTMTFKYGWAVGLQFTGMTAATTTVRFFVEGAPVPYYDVKVTYNQIQSGGVGNAITVDKTMLPEDAIGYVTALKFYPWTEIRNANGASDLSNFTNRGNMYPLFIISSATKVSDDFSVRETCFRVNVWGETEPEGLELVKLDTPTDYFRGYKITGLDANKAYEVSINGGEFTAIEAGTTELTDLISAVYSIRYAATATSSASAATSIYVPLINPAFSRIENSAYGTSSLTDWVDGRWSMTGAAQWLISESQVWPHFPITQNTTLSSVAMRYKFTAEEKFAVDEYPYLSFDFNDEMFNAFDNGNVTGAIFAVDVYVEGVDTPYTVNQAWDSKPNGHSLINSMYTTNRCIVNLLDEYPELAGKTVVGVRLRPYSNINDCLHNLAPADKKDADNYCYFRLYHLGFFETAGNVNAATPVFDTSVNVTFDSIRAESNTIYGVGAVPTISDFKVYEVFSDGTEFEVKNATVSVPELAEAGTYDATITWRGKTTIATVAVGLDSIKVTTAPEKVDYFEGEAVDLTGIVVTAVLGDGSEVEITENYTANVETVEVGMTEITVTYGGKTATFPITVKAIAVAGIEIVTYPDKELDGGWNAGETPDFTGLVVKVTYNNGDEEEVGLDALELNYGADVMTANTALIITYKDFSFAGYIPTVIVPTVTEIAIATPADKLSYTVGDTLDTTGLTLTATYNTGASATITEGFTAEADLSVAGTATVTVTYEGVTVTYNVEVRGVEMMFISQSAEKLEYVVGDNLDTTGLLVFVVYSDGTEDEISEGFTVECDEFTAAGTYTVTVSIGGFSETYEVTVTAPAEPDPVVTSITVTAPTKVEYTEGDTLDTTGMVVTANYDNGDAVDVTAEASVDTTVLNTVGTVTVTVTYGNFTDTFEVTVAAKVVEPEDIASGAIDGTDITWTIDADGVLTVSGTGTMPNYANTNSNRAPWYADRAKVTSIVVAEGMTSIGNFAFFNCTNATQITLPTTLTAIYGASIIRGTAITEVDLSNVEVLDESVFASATSVERVIFSESFKDARGNVFGGNTLNISVVAPESSYAYEYAELFTKAFPGKANITAVSDGTEATVPVIVMGTIGEKVFYSIYKESDTRNVMVISGMGATNNYWNISATRIAMDAEQGGNNFAPTYYMYEDTAVGRPILRNVKKLQILEGVTSIGNYAFYRCLKAQELEILGPVTRIGNAAFQACEAFRKITLPDTVTAIGTSAFNGCKYLNTITVPESVTSIGNTIFKNCLIEPGADRPDVETLTVKTTNQIFIDYIEANYPTVSYKIVLK